jgi:NAD(P)-dependent dehydrogenase (short-subunit alcohol dehydrogenase family)
MTSLMGSIADNSSGGSWGYRMSKAALNMASRNMAHELAADGIIAVVIHPGWVRTDMGGAAAPLTIQEAVAAMTRTMDNFTMDQAGGFYDRHGESMPW